MNKEEEPGKAEPVIAKYGIDWPQARTESIRDLIENRFMIRAWPTILVLDAERRIVAPAIHPEELEELLTKRLGEP